MGFIKLYRSLRHWRWYKDRNVKDVWIELLLTAAFADYYQGSLLIKRGQVLTSRKKLSENLNLSEQEVRTSLDKLQSTNEITTKKTNKGTLITIVEWEDYQSTLNWTNQQNNQNINQQSTNDQPAINQQSTNNQPTLYIKEDKEVKEIQEVKESFSSELYTNKPIEEMTVEELEQSMLDEENWIQRVNIIECWEEGFGAPPSSNVVMRLQDDIETHGIEKTYCALREAVLYGKKSIDYVETVLLAWKDMTAEQIVNGERPKKEE